MNYTIQNQDERCFTSTTLLYPTHLSCSVSDNGFTGRSWQQNIPAKATTKHINPNK